MRLSLEILQRIALIIFIFVGVAGALGILSVKEFLPPISVIITIMVFYELNLTKRVLGVESALANMVISFWAGFMPIMRWCGTTPLNAFSVLYLMSMPMVSIAVLRWQNTLGLRHDKLPEFLFSSCFLAFLMLMFEGWEYIMFILLVLWTSNFLLELLSGRLRLFLTKVEKSDNLFWSLMLSQLYGAGPFYLVLLVPVAFVTLSVLVVLWEFVLLIANTFLQQGSSIVLDMLYERVHVFIFLPYFIYPFYCLMKLMKANSAGDKDGISILPFSVETSLFSIVAVWHVFARNVRSDSVLGLINNLTGWQLWKSEVRFVLMIVMLSNLMIVFWEYLQKRRSSLGVNRRIMLSVELCTYGTVVFLSLFGNYFFVMLLVMVMCWSLFQSMRTTSRNERRLYVWGVFVSSIATWILGSVVTDFIELFDIPVEPLWLMMFFSGSWMTFMLLPERLTRKARAWFFGIRSRF